MAINTSNFPRTSTLAMRSNGPLPQVCHALTLILVLHLISYEVAVSEVFELLLVFIFQFVKEALSVT